MGGFHSKHLAVSPHPGVWNMYKTGNEENVDATVASRAYSVLDTACRGA